MKDPTPSQKPARIGDWLGNGFLALVLAFGFGLMIFGESIRLRLHPEMEEIRNILLHGDTLDRGFVIVSEVDPIPNPYRRGTGISAGFSYWKVAMKDDVTTGYFAYNVTGRRNLSDKHRTREMVFVYFEKVRGSPIKIVRVEPYSVWNQAEAESAESVASP